MGKSVQKGLLRIPPVELAGLAGLKPGGMAGADWP